MNIKTCLKVWIKPQIGKVHFLGTWGVKRKREKEGNELLCLLKGRLKGSNSRSA